MNGNKEALLLIDIQDVYFMPGPLLLHKPSEAAGKAALVLDKFRKEDKPVLFIKHDFKVFSGINKIVKPWPGEKIIEKKYPSSFLETDLLEYLNEKKIGKLIVVGMMSHMCVDTTVRACQDYGIKVTVIEDACTTQSLKFKGEKIPATTVHKAFMASLDGMFAKVVSLEEYL